MVILFKVSVNSVGPFKKKKQKNHILVEFRRVKKIPPSPQKKKKFQLEDNSIHLPFPFHWEKISEWQNKIHAQVFSQSKYTMLSAFPFSCRNYFRDIVHQGFAFSLVPTVKESMSNWQIKLQYYQIASKGIKLKASEVYGNLDSKPRGKFWNKEIQKHMVIDQNIVIKKHGPQKYHLYNGSKR